jgi:acetyltransferase
MNLEKLFNPGSVAIVGASPEEGTVGSVLAKNALELGYKGKVFLVNPKHAEIFGQKCYRSLAEISEPVDLAVVAIPAKFVNGEVKTNAAKIKNYVIISAGFGEIGEDGKDRQKELAELAAANNLHIIGPNCLGIIMPGVKLNASFAGGMPAKGNISFVSQSGALAVALLDIAKERNLGFAHVISIGNKMQISETELLEYLATDEKTKVIGMYLESVKDGAAFIKAARKVSKIKPVVILKAGKNEKAQKAISSHTGALAGSDEITSAVFKKTGVLRANSLEEFFSLIDLIHNSKTVPGPEAVVITDAGGVGVLTSDAFSGKAMRLADLDPKVKEKLREFLPEESSVENPIDLLGDAHEDRYQKALETVAGIKNVGAIICALTPQDQTPVGKIADVIIDFKHKTDKILATVFVGGERVEAAIKKLSQSGIANFGFPEQLINALDGYYRWTLLKEKNIKSAEQVINLKRQEKAAGIIAGAKAENRKALYFSEAKELMEIYGVKTVECVDILSEKNSLPAKINFPVVLKVDSDQVLHKTDKKGLVLNIQNKKELEKAVDDMRFHFPGNRLIVQPMLPGGLEIIVGVKLDSVFGPVVLYGLGGIYTEYLKMVDYLVPPENIGEIEESILTGKLKFLFQNARGQKNYDLEELAKMLLGICLMAVELPEIKEFDINPLIVYNDGKPGVAVDVKVII